MRPVNTEPYPVPYSRNEQQQQIHVVRVHSADKTLLTFRTSTLLLPLKASVPGSTNQRIRVGEGKPRTRTHALADYRAEWRETGHSSMHRFRQFVTASPVFRRIRVMNDIVVCFAPGRPIMIDVRKMTECSKPKK
jgi:hypothetical protein